jgi:UDPglucose--hexose-1-phosphate uridylyltransferase
MKVLLCPYLAMEEALGERLAEVNAGFVAVVPYWAVWPFEVMVLPRRHLTQL